MITVSSTVSYDEIVEPSDPHISGLLFLIMIALNFITLRQFSLTRVQPCTQAFASLESTRVIANVFVRAKANVLNNGPMKAYVNREKFVCVQSDYKYCGHDREDYHQNMMKRLRTLDPTECKHAIRPLNGTDNPQYHAFEYSSALIFFLRRYSKTTHF